MNPGSGWGTIGAMESMGSPDPRPQLVGADGVVAFLDAADLDIAELLAAIEQLVDELVAGAVVTVHSTHPAAVDCVRRWSSSTPGADTGPGRERAELVAHFAEGDGVTLTLRTR